MSDDVRVPNLWWSPSMGLLESDVEPNGITHLDFEEGASLPSDAVKLGDVEELQQKLEEVLDAKEAIWNSLNRVKAERDEFERGFHRAIGQRDALRTDVRAALESVSEDDFLTAYDACDLIRGYIDRE